MADPASAVGASQLGEAISTLLLFVGPAGIVAAFGAYFGYRARRRDEAREPSNPALSIAALYADRVAVEEGSRTIARLCQAIETGVEALRDQSNAIRDWTRAMRERTEAIEASRQSRRRDRSRSTPRDKNFGEGR